MPDNVGRWMGGASGWLLISIAELASGESDEDVLEGDLAMGDLAHAGVVLVLLDETSRCIDRQKLATIDDRHTMTDGLCLLHGVRRQEDAPSDVAQPFDSIP